MSCGAGNSAIQELRAARSRLDKLEQYIADLHSILTNARDNQGKLLLKQSDREKLYKHNGIIDW